jgi:hypothetical protein
MDGIIPAANTAGMRKGVAFGKGLVSSFLPIQHPHHQASRLKVSVPDKSFSTPNLGDLPRHLCAIGHTFQCHYLALAVRLHGLARHALYQSVYTCLVL